jgi:hypothetical protein
MDLIAGSGVLVLEERRPNIYVRDHLTTDMTNIFTRQGQVQKISDDIQISGRFALRQFIGTKYLPGRFGEIEAALGSTLKAKQEQEIIVGYIQPKAAAGADADTALVEAAYKPVFGLNYIVVTFNLKASI